METSSTSVEVDPEYSELCEICNAREAYGTFDVEDVETWVCAYCSALVEEVDGVWRIVWT